LLENRLGRIQSIIANSRRLKAGEKLDGTLEFLHEENRKFAAVEESLEVVAWALSDEAASDRLWRNSANPDALDEYLL